MTVEPGRTVRVAGAVAVPIRTALAVTAHVHAGGERVLAVVAVVALVADRNGAVVNLAPAGPLVSGAGRVVVREGALQPLGAAAGDDRSPAAVRDLHTTGSSFRRSAPTGLARAARLAARRLPAVAVDADLSIVAEIAQHLATAAVVEHPAAAGGRTRLGAGSLLARGRDRGWPAHLIPGVGAEVHRVRGVHRKGADLRGIVAGRVVPTGDLAAAERGDQVSRVGSA